MNTNWLLSVSVPFLMVLFCDYELYKTITYVYTCRCTDYIYNCIYNLCMLCRSTSQKRPDYLSWDEYFMAIAFLSAQRSKDPRTQVKQFLGVKITEKAFLSFVQLVLLNLLVVVMA